MTTMAVWRGLSCAVFSGPLDQGHRAFLRDLRQGHVAQRVRRLGQALVLSAEMPVGARWLHAHFIHTPASVTSYASLITGIPGRVRRMRRTSGRPRLDLSQKLDEARGVVACTKAGYDHLRALAREPARVHLSYHGLDLQRFGHFDGARSQRDGTRPEEPVVILSVGRAVPKKGYDILLRALALLKPEVGFRFVHVGGGEDLAA